MTIKACVRPAERKLKLRKRQSDLGSSWEPWGGRGTLGSWITCRVSCSKTASASLWCVCFSCQDCKDLFVKLNMPEASVQTRLSLGVYMCQKEILPASMVYFCVMGRYSHKCPAQ